MLSLLETKFRQRSKKSGVFFISPEVEHLVSDQSLLHAVPDLLLPVRERTGLSGLYLDEGDPLE